jgi:glycosyltransferase A (GT-A) superfamily protein (DUF2064 family)
MTGPAMTWRGQGEHVLVLAKEPKPGRVKTRLIPLLSPGEAAAVAAAALADTLAAVAACGATRRILALDGEVGEWLPPGFTVVAQRGTTFNARLRHAWHDAAGPGLQIGMDTPQVTAALLDDCLELTMSSPSGAPATAALGLAEDGGWWALGLSAPNGRDAFAGVPMSSPTTGRSQRAALEACGYAVCDLPVLRDIDEIDDLEAVAALAPASRLAATWQAIALRV